MNWLAKAERHAIYLVIGVAIVLAAHTLWVMYRDNIVVFG